MNRSPYTWSKVAEEQAACSNHCYVTGTGGCHHFPTRENSRESMELVSEAEQGWVAEPHTT